MANNFGAPGLSEIPGLRLRLPNIQSLAEQQTISQMLGNAAGIMPGDQPTASQGFDPTALAAELEALSKKNPLPGLRPSTQFDVGEARTPTGAWLKALAIGLQAIGKKRSEKAKEEHDNAKYMRDLQAKGIVSDWETKQKQAGYAADEVAKAKAEAAAAPFLAPVKEAERQARLRDTRESGKIQLENALELKRREKNIDKQDDEDFANSLKGKPKSEAPTDENQRVAALFGGGSGSGQSEGVGAATPSRPDVQRAAAMLGLPIDQSAKFRVSSRFGRREAPLPGASTNHGGLDLAVANGTPILAPLDGKVIASRRSSSLGNMVTIEHTADDGTLLRTTYGHMDKRAVKHGDDVSAQDQIGTAGRTGRATGNHLHMEVRVQDENGDWKKVDPQKYLPSLDQLNQTQQKTMEAPAPGAPDMDRVAGLFGAGRGAASRGGVGSPRSDEFTYPSYEAEIQKTGGIAGALPGVQKHINEYKAIMKALAPLDNVEQFRGEIDALAVKAAKKGPKSLGTVKQIGAALDALTKANDSSVTDFNSETKQQARAAKEQEKILRELPAPIAEAHASAKEIYSAYAKASDAALRNDMGMPGFEALDKTAASVLVSPHKAAKAVLLKVGDNPRVLTREEKRAFNAAKNSSAAALDDFVDAIAPKLRTLATDPKRFHELYGMEK